MTGTRKALRTTAATGAAMVLALLPMFLLGSLATFVRKELGFDRAALGITVAVFFAGSAASSIPGGRLAERVGAGRALMFGTLTSAITLVAVGTRVSSWLQLTTALAVAGLANGVIQPACNLALIDGVPSRQQGFAFGTKQAAAPVATLLAGMAVPGIALLWGWRWAFAGAALLLPVVWMLLPRTLSATTSSPPARSQRPTSTPTLILLATAAGLGAAAAATLGAFLVDTLVVRGQSPTAAGTVLMTGSIAGVVVRLSAGWTSDRLTASGFVPVAALLALGSVGFAAIGLGAALPVLALGAVLAFGAGWGWPGLFHFAVARRNPATPASSTSVALVGVYFGGVAGPTLFGFVAESGSLTLAWLGTAVGALTGAALMMLSDRRPYCDDRLK